MEENIKRIKYILEFGKKTGIQYVLETDDEKALNNILNELERLQKEFEAVDHECSRLEQKEIELENKKCLHCGNDTPSYCEKCQQELITKNAELQLENEELKNNKKVVANINIALDDMKEYIDGAINNILIENYIPKQVIRNKIELFTKQAEKFGENKCQWTNGGVINLLKEILGE